MIKSMLIVGAGGFVGSALRYAVTVLSRCLFREDFPLATFIVNVAGCLLIGIIFGLAERESILTDSQVLLLATGFCGGFTTFSAFANEAFVLGAKGDVALGALYVIASIVAGVLSVWAGRAIVA